MTRCSGVGSPPPALLGAIEAIASTSGTPLVYDSHATWGGDSDAEFAWLFAPKPLVFVLKGDSRHQVVTATGNVRTSSGSVLTAVMPHIGVDLPAGYFALHTRRFPWERYAIER